MNATFILEDGNDFAGTNEERAKWFPKGPRARQSGNLPKRPKGMKVSIAVIAEPWPRGPGARPLGRAAPPGRCERRPASPASLARVKAGLEVEEGK